MLGIASAGLAKTILAVDSATGEMRSRALLLFVARSKTGAAAGKLKRHSNPTSLARGRHCSAPLEPGRLSRRRRRRQSFIRYGRDARPCAGASPPLFSRMPSGLPQIARPKPCRLSGRLCERRDGRSISRVPSRRVFPPPSSLFTVAKPVARPPSRDAPSLIALGNVVGLAFLLVCVFRFVTAWHDFRPMSSSTIGQAPAYADLRQKGGQGFHEIACG